MFGAPKAKFESLAPYTNWLDATAEIRRFRSRYLEITVQDPRLAEGDNIKLFLKAITDNKLIFALKLHLPHCELESYALMCITRALANWQVGQIVMAPPLLQQGLVELDLSHNRISAAALAGGRVAIFECLKTFPSTEFNLTGNNIKFEEIPADLHAPMGRSTREIQVDKKSVIDPHDSRAVLEERLRRDGINVAAPGSLAAAASPRSGHMLVQTREPGGSVGLVNPLKVVEDLAPGAHLRAAQKIEANAERARRIAAAGTTAPTGASKDGAGARPSESDSIVATTHLGYGTTAIVVGEVKDWRTGDSKTGPTRKKVVHGEEAGQSSCCCPRR